MTSDAEVQHYVSVFVTSSNRVRHAILTITTVAILMFICFKNTVPGNWTDSRLKLARTARDCRSWEPDAVARCPGNSLVPRAVRWVNDRGLRSEQAVEERIAEIEKLRVERITTLSVPAIGVAFDVNDTGFFGSIALTILMIMLFFAMARQHENLVLALWKVRQIMKTEPGTHLQGESRSNLIYHVLAMSQHFSRPPTLAHWRKRRATASLTNVLVFIPLMVQIILLSHDLHTQDLGMLFSPTWTVVSLTTQVCASLIILFLTVRCVAYSTSNAKRWTSTFFKINPDLDETPAHSWLVRVGWAKPKPWPRRPDRWPVGESAGASQSLAV